MTEWGNLVLFNNEGAIVWQSFDYPTNTLLVGQRLYEDQKLFSSSSNLWAPGLYFATLKLATGFATYIRGKGQPQMYYQLVPDQTSTTNRGPYYAELQQGGSDGHLKIFYHSNANRWREIVDMVTHDLGECQHPHHCGEYGLCRKSQCSWPIGIDWVRYFGQTQSQNGKRRQQTRLQIPYMGCSRITSFSCPRPFDQKHYLVEVRNVSYFNLIDKDAAFPNISDIDRCREICLLNCSCGAVFFRSNNNVSDGYCYIPSTVLTIREGPIPNHSFASATFFKVQIPYKAANGQVEGTVPDTSPPTSLSRNRRNLKAIITSSCAGALLIFVVTIVTCFVMLRPSCSEDGEDCMKQVPGTLMTFSY
ncbi:G-type lectin S-receptor-like serine/threonine-protein kinase At1g61460 [Camellia sinensis]|uniref:G-type lectin S-receptor-like serine/threonine-protein kinase At1g61460 n=1 Tax=Camellia sinensis TaxID=4442 RepID=UPI0010355B03|nr:G-type lectin S-receptor-like serine/threonine-protein kinase At1g61460 [Camellia sinensis]